MSPQSKINGVAMPTVNQRRNELKSEIETGVMTKVYKSDKTEMVLDIEVFKNVHPVLQIDPERDLHSNVAIASEHWNYDAILNGVTENGNYEIKVLDRRSDRGLNSRRILYKEEVILHPDELTEEMLEQHGIEVYDGRSR